VIVQKAGDVIPEVVEVLKNLRTGEEIQFKFPKKCPVCAFDVIRNEDESAYRCINDNCYAQRRESLIHFASKDAMDINWLGEKVVDALLENALIQDSADFYNLKFEDFYKLPLFKEKKAQNLFESIQNSKIRPLYRFLFALGIRHLGEKMAEDLAKFVATQCIGQACLTNTLGQKSLFDDFVIQKNHLDNQKFISPNDILKFFESLSVEDLEKIDGVGEKVSKSIIKWFSFKKNKELLNKFTQFGLQFILPEKKKILNKFFDQKTFVLTGSLKSMSRNDGETKIKDLGGKILSSVTKNLDYLIVGENAGTKLEKAKKLRINVLNEDEFVKALGS
jgi:DNA ligase (NAD+)